MYVYLNQRNSTSVTFYTVNMIHCPCIIPKKHSVLETSSLTQANVTYLIDPVEWASLNTY